ncbi:hypothetical protein RD110_24750 [Rhodoferax koreense]|uniref:DUF3616 domain-containing protein n=2 Tax=Rhodoferax koreensis TaxID=1842727 RepID=A0A1P8K1Z0_9BURK|nr:hypothetical protein RD110_24750 [Rhodoferax koreense]
MRPIRFLGIAAALSALALASQAQPAVPPLGGIWPAGGGFVFKDKPKKARQAVSGIACAPNAQRRNVCLLAVDEGVSMPFAQVGDGRLQPDGHSIALGRDGDELDAEGAATDGAYFYVTGSHAVKRQSCAANPASRHVLRFRRDAATGWPAQPPDLRDATHLPALLATLPELAAATAPGVCLGRGGIDIEGLAVRAGRLFFGLRGPTAQDAAFIVSVDAGALFEGGDAKPRVHQVNLGAGRGLRDLLAVPDGILLLAGPDDDQRNADLPWTVLLWDDAETPAPKPPRPPKPLATLDLRGVAKRECDKEIKPEAFTLLDASPGHYRLLVLSDGLCDGGALAFDIPH